MISNVRKTGYKITWQIKITVILDDQLEMLDCSLVNNNSQFVKESE